MKQRRHRLSGWWDIFRSKKGFERFEGAPGLPAPKSGLPIVRPEPESLPIPSPSLLDAVRNLPILTPPPEAPGLLTPLIEQAAIPFGWIDPSTKEVIPSPEQEQKAEQELWAGMFEEEKERPVSIYEAFARTQEEKQVRSSRRPGDWPGRGREPRYSTAGWELPDTFHLMEVLKKGDPLDLNGLFDQALSDTSTSWWKAAVDESAHTGEAAELELREIASDDNAYQVISELFNIPGGVLEVYFGNPDDTEGAIAFHMEVVEELLARFSTAMDFLRPPALRGWFEISPGTDDNWWLKYVEGKFPQEQ